MPATNLRYTVLQPYDYIKDGFDRGEVELELYNPKGTNYHVHR